MTPPQPQPTPVLLSTSPSDSYSQFERQNTSLLPLKQTIRKFLFLSFIIYITVHTKYRVDVTISTSPFPSVVLIGDLIKSHVIQSDLKLTFVSLPLTNPFPINNDNMCFLQFLGNHSVVWENTTFHKNLLHKVLKKFGIWLSCEIYGTCKKFMLTVPISRKAEDLFSFKKWKQKCLLPFVCVLHSNNS